MLFASFLKSEYKYETAPVKRMIPLRHFDLQEAYGGCLYPYVAELKNGVLLLVDKNLKVVDVALQEDNLVGIDMNVLKEVAKKKNILFDWRKTTKDELIQLLKGS
jgi:hypothetical protein